MKPGTKLICINTDFGDVDNDVPKLNEEVTFFGMCHEFPGSYLIAEYHPDRYSYDHFHFRPLDEVLSKISISELLEEPVPC